MIPKLRRDSKAGLLDFSFRRCCNRFAQFEVIE